MNDHRIQNKIHTLFDIVKTFDIINKSDNSKIQEVKIKVVTCVIELVRKSINNIDTAVKMLDDLDYLIRIFININEKKIILKLIVVLGNYLREIERFKCFSFTIIAILLDQYDELAEENKQLIALYFQWITQKFNHFDIFDFFTKSAYTLGEFLEIIIDICNNENEDNAIASLEIIIYLLTIPESEQQKMFCEIRDEINFSDLIEISEEIESERVNTTKEYLKVCFDELFENEEESNDD